MAKRKEKEKKEEITGRNRSSDLLPIEVSRWLLAQCRYAPLTPFAFYTVLFLLNTGMLFWLARHFHPTSVSSFGLILYKSKYDPCLLANESLVQQVSVVLRITLGAALGR